MLDPMDRSGERQSCLPVIRCRQFVLAIGEQNLKTRDAFVASVQFSLGDGNLFFQVPVLLHELTLDMGELFEISLQESHFLLLRSVVGGP